MSLNDYFAANGAVYLRPVGLPDCFPMPGLPHGCKPPPLAMQHPCNPPQKPRTMAAVSPLHQVVPPQAPPIPPYEGGNMGFNSTPRTSSFAAALRKLAKQAVDPVTGEKDLSQISPVSSPVLNQTPKRNVPSSSMFHQGAFASTSPPVVTIAPSRPVATHTSDSRKQVMDLSTVPNNTSLSNGHIQEPIPVKMDSSKSGPRPAHAEKWEEPNMPSKGLSASSASSQRPHATIAPLPRPDDSLTSSRGFQPYRGSDESRNTLPHHISLFDHHPTAVSYPYSPAFLPPSHLSHPAYRFDDPLYLERYSLLRPPVMPYPQPGIMAPPAAFYPNSRYANDLIAQSLSLGGANNGMLNHERLKQEEERRMREKEIELDQSRHKEQERQKEKEQKEKESREKEREQKERDLREKEKREKEKSHHREKEEKTEHTEHKKERSSSSHSSSSKRTESPSVRPSTTVHNSSFHAVPTTSSSTPLNLVMQQHQAAQQQQHQEQQKKETELWMPWQQPVNHHPKENNAQDGGNSIKHPAFRPMENQSHQPVKENHANEKVPLRFSPTVLNEKKGHNPPPPVLQPNEPKKYPSEPKKFDSIHHHITELSSKDHGPHEWRHEKLQKACTNNHKKSHDSKKAKEAMSSHHRKTVNGAILKQQTFQNEGMHARLLESEKVRIEMNGQMQPKQPQQNVISVTNYKQNYPPVINKEVSASKTYLECYTPVTAPVVKSTVDLTPVVSKLDLEAKLLLKGDTKLYEDEEKSEVRLRNFLIITKGPPLKLDTSAPKLKFLKILGLTTHYKRKKVELDMYLKRRKILFEDSVVPPLSPESEEDKKNLPPPPLLEYSVHTERLAEQLRLETTPEKLEFFYQLNLTPITLVKKEERERVRRVVEEERMRRHYRMLAKMNKKASPRRLFVPKSEAAMKLDHLRKMREQNALFANNMYSKSSQEDEVFTDSSSSASTQMVTPKHEQVPYLSPSDTVNASSGKDGSELPYPHTKSFNKYSFKRGHSLKNEFRYEMPRPASKNNHTLSSSQTNSCSVSVSTQVDTSLLALGAESTLAALKNSVHWPGLESIMEAFYRHQHDQSNEKTILTERCHKLRKTQEELKKEADGLTKQMSDTLKSKRDLDEETFKLQRAIDRIKQCLQLGR